MSGPESSKYLESKVRFEVLNQDNRPRLVRLYKAPTLLDLLTKYFKQVKGWVKDEKNK